MPFLSINGWRVPVRRCELQPFEIGERARATDGSMLLQRRAVKRRWNVETALLQWIDGNALWQLVQGRGHQWRFNGSTSPQDTTGGAQLASDGGLVPTNTPNHTIERTTAVDGSAVNWAYSTTQSASPSAFGAGSVFVSEGTTNLLSSNTRTCEDSGTPPAGWSVWNGATVTSTTSHKWQGTRSVSVVTPNVTANEGAIGGTASLTSGVAYVASVYVKAASAFSLDFRAQRPAGAEASTTFTTVANTWVRVFLPFTAGATTTFDIRVSTPAQASRTFFIDGAQIEALTTSQSNIATPWADGTRAASNAINYTPTIVQAVCSHTVSAWVRCAPGSSDGEDVVLWYPTSTSSGNFSALQFDSSRRPVFKLADPSNTRYAATGTALAPGASWHHLVGVYDSYAATVSLYVDGSLVQTTSYASSSVPNFSSASVLCIGGEDQGTGGQFWAGIDEVTILPFAASSTLVTALYTGAAVPWLSLPKLRVEGDGVDGVATCIGNTSRGTYAVVQRSGVGIQKNNLALSFDLEEV